MIQNFRQKSEALKEAQEKRNCCLCAGVACAGTAGVACVAVMVGIMSVPLILATLSDRSEELALASAICNSAWVFMAFVGRNSSTNGCSALLYVGALITSWIYWSQWYNNKPLNSSLQDATIGMTVFAPILSILGAWLSKDEE